MKKNSLICIGAFLFALAYTIPIYCNVIWPAVFVSNAIYSSLFVVIVSIIIEAILFCAYIKTISYERAFLMSFIGNAISALLGTAIMTFAMLIWHFPLDILLGGTFHIVNIIATYILMCLGSAFIELLSIKLLFRYSFKQLWVPVLIGNILTYVLVVLLNYSHEIKMLFS
jgi:hypothetical protein